MTAEQQETANTAKDKRTGDSVGVRLLFSVVGILVGGASTVGFDYLKAKYLKTDDPLAQGVTELTHISKELILEQKALNKRIVDLSSRNDIPQEIKIEVGDIINRVNNIVSTTVQFEAKSRDVTGIAKSVRSSSQNSFYNANADLVLSQGQGVTLCGNENTLSVTGQNNDRAQLYVNGQYTTASVGEEYGFVSPAGNSLVSYLGKNGDHYEFRIVCNTQLKKI